MKAKHNIVGVSLVAVALFAGCRVGPDYHGPPTAPVAGTYTNTPASDVGKGMPNRLGDDNKPKVDSKAIDAKTADDQKPGEQKKDKADAAPNEQAVREVADLTRWWQSFDDPLLNEMIYRGASQNLSLREACWRINESRARAGTVRSGLFPQIDTDASYFHQKQSSSSGGFSFPSGLIDTTNDFWSWGTNLNWEVDVFGRLHRLVEASEADVDASVELYRNTLLMLLSDVARNYVDARSYQQQIKIIRQNIQIQERTLDIAKARLEVGRTDELDFSQARGNLMSSYSELPDLETGYRRSINRLSVLLGCTPGYVDELMSQVQPIPRAPDEVTTGIPAELLRRRPDVREAERRLAAQTARIGAAVGDLYPQFSITGTFGIDAQDFSNWFTGDSINAGIGPSMRWNILNFGKYRCNVVAQEALAEQLAAKYQLAVLTAAEEVDNALTAYVREKRRRAYLVETVQSYSRAVEISQKKYEGGVLDFQRVLDSQRALITFQSQLVRSDANVTTDVILLYRALGGGWQCPVTPPMTDSIMSGSGAMGTDAMEVVPMPEMQRDNGPDYGPSMDDVSLYLYQPPEGEPAGAASTGMIESTTSAINGTIEVPTLFTGPVR